MKLFDLHCDTAYSLYHEKQPLADGNCHISLDRSACFERYAQVMAVWTSKRIDNQTGFTRFHVITDNLLRQIDDNRHRTAFCRSTEQMHAAWEAGKSALFLAVEDARILDGEIDRLDVLYARGVRFLTLTWAGSTCIGGSHDTADGLTDFGRLVVQRCFALGIIPDVSHASDATAAEVLELARTAGKPVIATHSNSRTVCNASRNLTDDLFTSIRDSGGIVGISLCPPHLAPHGESRTPGTVVDHIEHYLSLGGADTVCFGFDLDGTSLPEAFGGIQDIGKIADEMVERGHSADLIDAVFWKNAVRFIDRHLTENH